MTATVKRIAAAVSAALIVSATGARAATSAREAYESALARERTVREALAPAQPFLDTLKDVRALVAAYDAVVRRYPASGYSDNALWQGGQLALDAFAKFGDPHDRAAGVAMLKRLASEYPASSLAKRVPSELARVDISARVIPAVNDEAQVATIRSVRRAVLPEAVRITIELDREVPFHDERIDSPSRVFVDLASTRPLPDLADKTLRFDSDADIVRQVRIGTHPNHTTRVVLDAGGVSTYGVYALYNPFRLVIDCARVATPRAKPTVTLSAKKTTPPPLLASRRIGARWEELPPSTAPSAAASARQAADAETPAAASTRSGAAPPAPPAPANGTYSIARQLGLGVSRIVIDPGHGGHDPGAKGKGVTEAELVLDIALRLEALLKKQPGVEVILTRRTDEFVPLQERTALANREGADLFLSIHANASERSDAHGVETYFLNFANTLSAAAVAARENAASGQAMGALPDLVKAIALNNKLDESRDFATEVQQAMVERLRGTNKSLKNLGVKQAPFVVLIGAAMPSVLAEISFVTNPQEAKLLRSSAYRQRIADALLAAIRKYQTSLRRVSTVASQ